MLVLTLSVNRDTHALGTSDRLREATMLQTSDRQDLARSPPDARCLPPGMPLAWLRAASMMQSWVMVVPASHCPRAGYSAIAQTNLRQMTASAARGVVVDLVNRHALIFFANGVVTGRGIRII